jgi:GT2 family glycosyltransferase
MAIRVAVLMTCFNRKNFTVNCVGLLKNQVVDDLELDIFLVDDGSTDGTSLSVQEQFNDVNIIQGNGMLFWNGGMRLAWEKALTGNYDFYLWVNDDSFIFVDSIKKLIMTNDTLKNKKLSVGAILGSMVDPITKKLTYGGRLKNSWLNPLRMGPIIQPENEPVKCDFINGNLTLIPKETVDKIGILSPDFTHSMGDFDYGLRAIDNEMDCWVAPGIYGECKANSLEGSWRDKTLPQAIRLNKLKSITQLPPGNEWKIFIKRHAPFVWPLLWVKALIRIKFPRIWLLIH